MIGIRHNPSIGVSCRGIWLVAVAHRPEVKRGTLSTGRIYYRYGREVCGENWGYLGGGGVLKIINSPSNENGRGNNLVDVRSRLEKMGRERGVVGVACRLKTLRM